MSIVARFYPNGEFTHGVDTSRARKPCKKPGDRPVAPTHLSVAERVQQYAEMSRRIDIADIEKPGQQYRNRRGERYTVVSKDRNGLLLRWECVDGKTYLSYTQSRLYDWLAADKIRPLACQLLESSESARKPSRKRLQTMTKSMGRNIRNAMYLLEHQPGGKDMLSFLTLTLPRLSPEGLDSCCANWNKMVARFLDWLKKRLQAKAIEFQYVYCTEIQLKRLHSSGEYVPHLHLVFKGRNGKKQSWAITPKDARRAWSRCISAYVRERFSTESLENLQRIKYSAARYLSKYMSKGAKESPNEERETIRTSLHTQWGGISRNLSRAVRQRITLVRGMYQWDGFWDRFSQSIPHLLERKLLVYYKAGLIPVGHPSHPADQKYLKVGTGCLARPLDEGGLIRVMQALEF